MPPERKRGPARAEKFPAARSAAAHLIAHSNRQSTLTALTKCLSVQGHLGPQLKHVSLHSHVQTTPHFDTPFTAHPCCEGDRLAGLVPGESSSGPMSRLGDLLLRVSVSLFISTQRLSLWKSLCPSITPPPTPSSPTTVLYELPMPQLMLQMTQQCLGGSPRGMDEATEQQLPGERSIPQHCQQSPSGKSHRMTIGSRLFQWRQSPDSDFRAGTYQTDGHLCSG